jgi:hypothetical protein
LRLDGGGQFVQRLLVHVGARLVLAGLQVVDAQRVLALRLAAVAGQQGVEPAAEAFRFGSHVLFTP